MNDFDSHRYTTRDSACAQPERLCGLRSAIGRPRHEGAAFTFEVQAAVALFRTAFAFAGGCARAAKAGTVPVTVSNKGKRGGIHGHVRAPARAVEAPGLRGTALVGSPAKRT